MNRIFLLPYQQKVEDVLKHRYLQCYDYNIITSILFAYSVSEGCM